MANTKQQTIKSLALFKDCTEIQLRWLAEHADEVDVPAGRTLAVAGARAREFVVIVGGSAAAFGGRAEIVMLPGAWFGDRELLSGRPHSSTISTLEPCRLLVCDARVFASMLDAVPVVARALLRGARSTRVQAEATSRSFRAVS